MKANFGTRVLSVVLCTVMLFSCWVFTAPIASAASTGPSSTYGNQEINSGTTELAGSLNGRYRVRLCIHEDDGFDQSLHDNDNYVPGIVYADTTAFTNGASKRNLTGTSRKNDLNALGQSNPNDKQNNGTSDYPYWCEYAQICYKNMNGTGDEGAVWFNMGDYDGNGRDSVISGGGYDYGYFPSENGVVINGFPTSFRVRYRDKAGADLFGANHGGFSVYLQVAVWDATASNWTWSEGTCTGTPAVWGAFGGGWDSAYGYGIGYGETGSIKNVNGGIDIPLGSTAIANTYYPQASTTRRTKTSNGVTAVSTAPAVSYGTSKIYCPKTSTATITTTNKSDLSFTSPKDQYGTYMAANITTELSRDDKSDTDFTQSGLTTAATYTANIDGTTSLQYVSPTVTWPQKTGTSLSRTLTGTSRLYVYDAQYTVKFKDASGNTIQNGTSGDLTRTVYYGSNATAPAASTYAKAYDTTNHYTFNTWDPSNTNVTEDRICVPQYNEIPHTMENDDTLPDYQAATCTEAGVQTRKCSANCGYTDTQPISALGHDWVRTDKEAVDNDPGYVYYCCERNCGNYHLAKYENGKYSVDEQNEYTSISQMEQSGNKVSIPAPYFNDSNTYESIYEGFDYSKRLASIKYMSPSETGSQTMRYAGSVKIPEGVEITNTNADNNIIDFGFVYTQESFILGENDKPDPDKLVFCEDEFYNSERKTNYDNPNEKGYRVYKMSLAENNAPSTNISDWTGCTPQNSGNTVTPDYLSFNLVINIKAKNWHVVYVARPYVTYKYHNVTYTVYDGGASSISEESSYYHRSVCAFTDSVMSYAYYLTTEGEYEDEYGSYGEYATLVEDAVGEMSYEDYCAGVSGVIRDKKYIEERIIDYLDSPECTLTEEQKTNIKNEFKNQANWLSSADAQDFLDYDLKEKYGI